MCHKICGHSLKLDIIRLLVCGSLDVGSVYSALHLYGRSADCLNILRATWLTVFSVTSVPLTNSRPVVNSYGRRGVHRAGFYFKNFLRAQAVLVISVWRIKRDKHGSFFFQCVPFRQYSKYRVNYYDGKPACCTVVSF